RRCRLAVYKRTYKGYAGPLTHPATRFLVLQRYAFRAVFKSRMLLMAHVACFIPSILAICVLYLNQNASVLALIQQRPASSKLMDCSSSTSWRFSLYSPVC